MSKKIERATQILRDYISYVSNKNPNADNTYVIEEQLKKMFLGLKEKDDTHNALKRELTFIINHLSFSINPLLFNEEEFFNFMESWIHREIFENKHYLFHLAALLPQIIQERIITLQERQENLANSFLEWTKDTLNTSSVNALKNALIAIRLGTEHVEDPGELASFIQFVIKPTVEKIVSQLKQPNDANTLILALEKLGDIWSDAIYSYSDSVDQSSEIRKQEQMALAYHHPVYLNFIHMLRNEMPLNSDIETLLSDILGRQNKFKIRREQYTEQMKITGQLLYNNPNLLEEDKAKLIEEQLWQNRISPVLSSTIEAIAWMKTFLDSRHIFDEKNGIREAQEQQKRFIDLYYGFCSKKIPENLSLERCIQHDCIIELRHLITVLDHSIDWMKTNIEENISSLQDQITQLINATITSIQNSKHQEKEKVVCFLNTLLESTQHTHNITDICALKTIVSDKLISFMSISDNNASRISRLLYKSTDRPESHRSSPWDEVKILLMNLSDIFPDILIDEDQRKASETAKYFTQLGIRRSTTLNERFSQHRLSNEESIHYALLHEEQLNYRNSFDETDKEMKSPSSNGSNSPPDAPRSMSVTNSINSIFLFGRKKTGTSTSPEGKQDGFVAKSSSKGNSPEK